MKLPKEVKSRHKLRDAAIVKLAIEGKTQLEIGVKFGLTRNRIQQILCENSNLLLLDKNYEKFQRINRLKRALSKAEEDGLLISDKKDFIDIQKELRAELEGEKNLVIDQSTHQHVTYVWNNEDDKNQLRTSELPALDSQQ